MDWYSQLLAITADPQDWIDCAILISWGGFLPAVLIWALCQFIANR